MPIGGSASLAFARTPSALSFPHPSNILGSDDYRRRAGECSLRIDTILPKRQFISPSDLSSSVCGSDAVDRPCHPSSKNSIPASNRNSNLMRDATSWRPRKTSHTLLKHIAVQASALIVRITSCLPFETPNSSLRYSTSKEFGPS